MNFGLSEKTIVRMQEVFAKCPQVQRVVLYGSRAKGNYQPGSDIDLTLFGRDLKLRLQMQIEHELDELLLPYTIDLSVFSNIDNPELIDHIIRVGKVFYVREDELPGR